MKKLLLALLILASATINAQHTVKGTMTPPEKSDWVILYEIEGANQKFITNTTIKFDTVVVGGEKQILGKFQFQLPAGTKKGVYRASYRNSGSGFVDFYFNNENVEFIFNPKYADESIVFTSSRENKLYQDYMQTSNKLQKEIDVLQASYIEDNSKDTKKQYKKNVKALEDLQDSYENKSEGMFVNTFIKASKKYNPSSPKVTVEEYMSSTVKNFFNYVDFKSEVLFSSPLLIDKITQYIFQLNFSEDYETQQQHLKDAITGVLNKITSKKLENSTITYLIKVLTAQRNGPLVDWLFENYYDKLPSDKQDSEFKKETLATLRATVGRIAPDFSWKENGKEMKLSTLNDGGKYLLIFWSTNCPHCVKEIPVLHESMKNRNDISIISFGIENDSVNWTEFVKTLPNWHNAIGTHPENKWDNEIVQTYQLLATPTYFVLDKNKKIIAIPEQMEDVQKYFS